MTQLSFIWSIPKEEFEQIVKNSNSFNDVKTNLGFKHAGNIRTVKQRILNDKIDTKHFYTKNIPKKTSNKKISLDKLLKKNNGYKINNQILKKRLIEANMMEDKCVECNISSIWNGKKLTLQLDHIDGNNENNELSNLRILCPNCHSQTDTWCANKNKKVFTEKYLKYKKYDHNIIFENFKELPFKNSLIDFCKNCNINEICQDNKSKLCRTCLGKSKIRYDGLPTLEQLEKDVKELNYTQTGKKYNVSDNTIRKWLIKLKNK